MIQALVLAGGEGKRFWPLITSKAMFPFYGKPLIAYQLEQIHAAGFNNITVVTSPQNHADISNLRISHTDFHTVTQPQANGMAAGILMAESLLSNEPLLIVNATDVVDKSLYKIAYQNLEQGKNFITAKQVDQYFPGGYLHMEQDHVVGISEKPGSGNEPSDLVKLVFDGFQDPKALITAIKTAKSTNDDVYEIAFTQLLQQKQFSLIPYDGYWQATKYPWHILPVMELLLKSAPTQISKTAAISPKAIIEGNVVIEDRVRVFENAIIKGPAYIGQNTIIGNGALVRQVMIGGNCVVGYNTEVARSWVGNDCWFHSNYVGDSVLEGNVSMGAGSILANLRLDEAEIESTIENEKMLTQTNKLGATIGKNVRIGVNTSLMPGIKIGSNSLIGAGITVAQDIPDNSFVKAETKVTISPNTRSLHAASREKFKTKL